MVQLRLTNDDWAPPSPIPFPGRRDDAGPTPGPTLGSAPGRGAGRLDPMSGSAEREVEKALAHVQAKLDDLNNQLEAFDPIPMRAWRYDPEDDGPRAA